jgi:hypothetical protein
MAVHTTLSFTPGVWSCINPASPAAGDFSIIPEKGYLYVKPMPDGTNEPIDTLHALLLLAPKQSLVGQTIAKVWPGRSTYTYLWVWSPNSVTAMVSCA